MGILTRGYLGFSRSLHPVGSRWCRHSIEPPDSRRSWTSAKGRDCVKTRTQFDFPRFQGSSDHCPARKNRLQLILRGRFSLTPILFAFSHSLGRERPSWRVHRACPHTALATQSNTERHTNFYLSHLILSSADAKDRIPSPVAVNTPPRFQIIEPSLHRCL